MVTANTYAQDRTMFEVFTGSILDGAGATTRYYALRPNARTSIIADKNGMSVVISITNTQLADLENAAVVWGDVSTGTADYVAGDSVGLTGIKIVSTPVGANVNYAIKQYVEADRI